MEEQTNWIYTTGCKKNLARIKIDYRSPTAARKNFPQLEKGNNRWFCIYLVESAFLASFYLLIHDSHLFSRPPKHGVKDTDFSLSED